MSAPRSVPRQETADREPALLAPLLAILARFRDQAGALTFGLLVSLAALGFGMALLGVAGLRLAGASAGLLLISAWWLRGVGIGRVVLRYGERLLTHGAMFKALADLRVWFFRRLAASAAGGLGFRRTGDALSRLVSDVEALDGLYLRLLLPLCGALLTLPVLAVLLGRTQPLLALVVCLLFGLGAFLLPWRAARRSAAGGRALSRDSANLRIAVLDLVGALREIRAYGAGGRAMAVVQARETDLLASQSRLAAEGAFAGAAAFLCGQGALLAVLAACIGLGLPHIPALAAALFLFVLLAAFEASSGLVRAGVLAGYMAQSATRLLETEIRDTEPALVAASGKPISQDVSLRFDQVGFRWQPDRAPVFDGLTLGIPQGARIGLLGPSGSGKSTLAALLLRTVLPQSGRIMMGETDLSEIDEPTLRRRIAWLGQQSHLFDDSIRNNLLLGRPEATEADLWLALEQAQIADLVRSLPDQLDAWLGEAGTRVSGGQGRRLALARVLLSTAPVLILDEPCAGLDSETERQFLETLNAVGAGNASGAGPAGGAGRTMILIVHRLTGVERLDRTWRLHDGRAFAAG